MKPTTLKSISLGTGTPKICVPITGSDPDEVVAQAGEVISTAADIIEWRLDYLNNLESTEQLREITDHLTILLGNLPLMVTLRDRAQGGKRQIADADYQSIYTQLIEHTSIAAVDLESHRNPSMLNQLLTLAQANHIRTIVSQHHFDNTPQLSQLVTELQTMANLQGDFVKLAVMPENNGDVLNLMNATYQVAEQIDTPIISMAMGAMGVATRVTGQTFGSVMTFATVRHRSAPGQLTVEQTKKMIEVLDASLPEL